MNDKYDVVKDEIAFRSFVVQQLNFLSELTTRLLSYVSEDDFEKELYGYGSNYYNSLVMGDDDGAAHWQEKMKKATINHLRGNK